MAAKKKKKVGVNKVRRVRVLNKERFNTETVDVRLYKLNSELAAPFVSDGLFRFRVAFDKTEDGIHKFCSKSRCPLISIPVDAVIQTENETAQRMIEHFAVPTRTERNGKKRKEGLLFQDVTATTDEYDVDLDSVFAGV